jgi:thiol:disulfide interchange protein DsbC
MNTLRIVLLAMLALGCLAADSQPTEPVIEKVLEQLGVTSKPSELPAAPIPNFLEIRRGVQVLYISSNGDLLINGDILSLANETNLTERSRAAARVELIATIPRKQRIIVPAEAHARGQVVVFVDADCPYCRALHERLAAFTAQGFEVHLLFYPRSGPSSESYDQAIAVWCASDKKSALEAVLNGVALPTASCQHPIDEHYALAGALDLKGTPAVVTPDGEIRYGVVDVDELLR